MLIDRDMLRFGRWTDRVEHYRFQEASTEAGFGYNRVTCRLVVEKRAHDLDNLAPYVSTEQRSVVDDQAESR